MSIIGLTIDYGPFGFMDRFDPEFICNSSDDGGRYTYAKQPEICKWNCEKLAHALKDQMPQEESLRILEESYYEVFNKHYLEKMKKKLGIIYSENSNDKNLIDGLLSTMHKTGADFTNTWRVLTNLSYEFDTNSVVEDCLVQCCSIDEVRESLKPTMPRREMQMMLMVLQSNPGLLEQLGRGALRLVNELNKMEKLEELKNDTNESKKEKDKQLWTDWLELYRSRLSDDLTTVRKNDDYLDTANRERATLMNAVNPRFVLRNHLAEEAIILAEKGDFSGVRSLLGSFEYVYNRGNGIDSSTGAEGMSASIAHYEIKPPPSAMKLKVS